MYNRLTINCLSLAECFLYKKLFCDEKTKNVCWAESDGAKMFFDITLSEKYYSQWNVFNFFQISTHHGYPPLDPKVLAFQNFRFVFVDLKICCSFLISSILSLLRTNKRAAHIFNHMYFQMHKLPLRKLITFFLNLRKYNLILENVCSLIQNVVLKTSHNCDW